MQILLNVLFLPVCTKPHSSFESIRIINVGYSPFDRGNPARLFLGPDKHLPSIIVSLFVDSFLSF
ncbi:hypothetical protein HMPREF9413_2872 [Paenibacillus sp. HGF7]|nr:hypothetical protein HMPREF9413_2872 [Paenibacillus sp. HGF7]